MEAPFPLCNNVSYDAITKAYEDIVCIGHPAQNKDLELRVNLTRICMSEEAFLMHYSAIQSSGHLWLFHFFFMALGNAWKSTNRLAWEDDPAVSDAKPNHNLPQEKNVLRMADSSCKNMYHLLHQVLRFVSRGKMICTKKKDESCRQFRALMLLDQDARIYDNGWQIRIQESALLLHKLD